MAMNMTATELISSVLNSIRSELSMWLYFLKIYTTKPVVLSFQTSLDVDGRSGYWNQQ
jgi:hypothetical protein